MTNSKVDRKELSWGNNRTSLFLVPNKSGGFSSRDYEFDHDEIHDILGGKLECISEDGQFGNGWVPALKEFIQVGYYLADATSNNNLVVRRRFEDWEILLPYTPHTQNKVSLFKKYPCIVTNQHRVIFASFFDLAEALENAFSNTPMKDERKISKEFISAYCAEPVTVSIDFSNVRGFKGISPWRFVPDRLASFVAENSPERVHHQFKIGKIGQKYVLTERIGSARYAVKAFDGDPCETVNGPMDGGWECLGENIVYRISPDDTVHIMGWKKSQTVYEQVIDSFAETLPEEKQVGFKSKAMASIPVEKYVSTDMLISKVLFFIKKQKLIDEVQKAIENKVLEKVQAIANEFEKNPQESEG